MKGLTSEWPYQPLEGLNPFQEELKSNAKTLEFQAMQIGILAKLSAYFAGFSEVTSDDIGSIYTGSNSITFNLAVKESRFVHALAQFTGLEFEKRRAYDGKSINLNAKVPDGHALKELGITQVFVAGYLPEGCAVVVKEYKPLDEKTAEVYKELLEKGCPVYETKCGEEEVSA